MKSEIKKLLLVFFLNYFFIFSSNLSADNHEINEILERLQKDIKTLEKAVYSGSTDIKSEFNNSSNNNSEDVLTRHLLKLSEIENQFQE